MKLSAAFSILFDLKFAVSIALGPTVKEIRASPSLLLRPAEVSGIFFAHLWKTFGPGVDGNGRPVKQDLITPHAYGTVLDIGAGHGHTVNYLDRERVTKYIALEPNTLMHPQLREIANKAGYTEQDDTLVILGCGAEDREAILAANGGPVDTIVSILTLCTVPEPKQTIETLVNNVLAPGGQLLFYEHVLSPRKDVAWWQAFWAPVWQVAFDGCRIDRPTHLWVEEVRNTNGSDEDVWKERNVWGKLEEPEENLFWHRAGRYIKR